jgi:hypothetical protein
VSTIAIAGLGITVGARPWSSPGWAGRCAWPTPTRRSGSRPALSSRRSQRDLTRGSGTSRSAARLPLRVAMPVERAHPSPQRSTRQGPGGCLVLCQAAQIRIRPRLEGRADPCGKPTSYLRQRPLFLRPSGRRCRRSNRSRSAFFAKRRGSGRSAHPACPSRQQQPGSLLGVEPQEQIGEADDRAATLVAEAADRLRQSVVGPMGERVSIYDQERTSVADRVRCLLT